jgi:hypothetical protein
MKRILFSSLYLSLAYITGYSQSVPNALNAALSSPTSGKASQLSSVPVNIFTGVPGISVPIYSYSNANNGLSLDIGLSYFAGGVQVAESPTTTGLGWFLNVGGTINRSVRGMPDDIPQYGSLYSAAIPVDYRTNGNKYYYDSLDAQQDVFQFSFGGRSGKFYIGKNAQIVLAPVSKLKVVPSFGTSGFDSMMIRSFRIITEDGVKYDFKDGEVTTIAGGNAAIFKSGYHGKAYYSSWYLSQVISSFNTDTIKLTYNNSSVNYPFSFPQTTFVRNSDGVRTVTHYPTGTNSSGIKKIASIVFPDKTKVSFVYSYNENYYATDNPIAKIKIGDSTFRYGYLLEYQGIYGYTPCRLLLKSVTPYTAKEKKDGYIFQYDAPIFPREGSAGDTIQNKRDHWGFYNGANNGIELIPKINSNNWGANRDPVLGYAYANLLDYCYLPGGGRINYEYELNDHYPYIKDPKLVAITANTNSQNTIALNQVFNTKHQLVLTLDNTVSRQGSAPISGTGTLTVNIKSTDGVTLYKTVVISLYDLFYLGMKTWTFNLSNGSYRLETVLSGGTTITGSFPVNITWENKLEDASKTKVVSGGLRIGRIIRYTIDNGAWRVEGTEDYKYVREDGKSSGFFGDIPKYDYPYKETVNFGGTTNTNYTVVSSEPVSTMNYAQGSPVGYSRVEVYKGTTAYNLGKTVYEFTGLADVNTLTSTAAFPYTPPDSRDWGLGLPKKVSVYDSIGRLVKRTVNTIVRDTIVYNNSNFKSLKLGHSFTTINGDPANSATPKINNYTGEEYYATSGRAYISATADTLYQLDGTVNASAKSFVYDTCYNITKITSGYDRNRNLQLEQRIYYPYHYTVTGAVKKLKDSSIISPVVATESWIVGDANPRIVSAEIKSFKQLASGQIKADSVFSLESNKPIAQATITVFNPAMLNRNTTHFKPQLRFLNYDSKGNLTETVSLKSGQSSSVIMDYGLQYAIAKVSNAANSDVAYSSFESDGAGNWTIASTVRDSLNALTGRKSYNLSNGNITKTGLSASKPYLLTLWLKSGATATVNGAALPASIASQIGWNLYSVSLSSVTSVTISGTGLIDEVRLHPKDANMMTSTYEPMIGVTSAADANNTIIYNEYDNLNRIKLIRDKDKNIIKRYDYSDSARSISLLPVYTYTFSTCRNSTGDLDSTFTNWNLYSDNYGATQVTTKQNHAPCCTAPLYKMVNGICELALRNNTSTTYMKINNPPGTEPPQVWVWRCIWHYEWSDGTWASPEYTEYNQSSCTLGIGEM